MIRREIYAEIPPRVEYFLTPLSEDLARALRPLEEWGDRQPHGSPPLIVA